MDILGDTIAEITKVKMGIIKKNRDTIMYEQDKVTDIIKKECAEKNNNLHLLNRNDVQNYSYNNEFQKIDYKNYKNILINLKGKCQIYNAMLCLECINVLREKGYNIEEKAIKEGLKTVVHKARFETLNESPKIIFDGGHNENAIKNLKKMIEQYYKNDKKIYIISILKTKDYKTAIRLLSEDKDSIFIFTSGNDENRYNSKEDLFSEAKKYLDKNIYTSDLKNAIKYVRENCKDEVIMVVRKLLCI